MPPELGTGPLEARTGPAPGIRLGPPTLPGRPDVADPSVGVGALLEVRTPACWPPEAVAPGLEVVSPSDVDTPVEVVRQFIGTA